MCWWEGEFSVSEFIWFLLVPFLEFKIEECYLRMMYSTQAALSKSVKSPS